MRKIFVLLLLILSTGGIFAQNPQKAFKLIKKGEYEKAKIILKKSAGNPKNYVASKYGLALIFSSEDYKNKNLKLAFLYISSAEKKYLKSPQEHKKYLKSKYDIDLQAITSLKEKILNEAYSEVDKSSLDQMNDFIYNFPGTEQAKKLSYIRDSIIYQRIKKINSPEFYKQFAEEYPDNVFADSALEQYRKLWKKEYDRVFRSLEYNDIVKFKKRYKDSVFTDDSSQYYTSLAMEAYNLMMHQPYDEKKFAMYDDFIKKAAPSELAFVALQRVLSPYIEAKNWQKAYDVALQYRDYFSNSKKYNDLLKLLLSPENKVKPKSFSSVINSETSQEYAPLLTADENTLYFCSQGRPGQIGGEDIFVSYKIDGQWQKPQLVSELSTIFNEAPMSVTADGNTMLLFYNGNIYSTEKTKKGWSQKKPIEEINTQYWESDAFITADGNAILFASDRPGGQGTFHEFSNKFHGDYIGNIDLYVIVKQKDGTWSEPINLGPVINTPYAERTPFLHPDMKTLYFSSDGHGGFGTMDVFMSKRLSDTSWTQWSEPVNLGKGINTPKKEYGYKVSTDGTISYFSTIQGNQADIFYIDLPESVKPEAVAVISGVVKEYKTNKALEANIVWEDLETGKQLGTLKTDPQNGKYVITLPLGKNYGFYISKKGYYPLSANIDLRNKEKKSLKIHKSFKMIPVRELLSGDVSIKLNNIFFDTDKYDLKPESYPELNRLADFIKQHPDIKIEIAGHTDNVGTAEYNKTLSEKRAKAVKDYLVKQGCNPSQLITVGYGDTKPVATNDTEEGRQQNRRVEFRVIK